MIYFISDTHFGHLNILDSCKRPFESIEEMNETLIANWNKKVTSDEDEVYIVGDFSYRSREHVSIYLNRLRGRKHLIIGNHDFKWIKNVPDMEEYFASVSHMELINLGKKLITLCHYPMIEWNRSRYAKQQEGSTSWLIHGHIHNDREGMAYIFIKENLPCALNAGVDINGFEPVTFEELLKNNNEWYGRNLEDFSENV